MKSIRPKRSSERGRRRGIMVEQDWSGSGLWGRRAQRREPDVPTLWRKTPKRLLGRR